MNNANSTPKVRRWNAYLLAIYLDGIDTFIRGTKATLEFLPKELGIAEYSPTSLAQTGKKATLSYSRIIGVEMVRAGRYGDVGIFRNIRLETNNCLVIKYYNAEGAIKELGFQTDISIAIGEYHSFINSLRIRIPSPSPKQTEL